ncbi:disease resistance protein RGA5-like isoform X1 [Lolium rigidum]|uniref:disease resistance protein RGA5-like isoform X1 n=1 Tax=Lolium rigidum TaxID=89674 RepID=UPI001F5D7E7F|nr:disease resistance protein RGA5-like isoform X1 [Lolium rigidum]
MEGPPMVCYSMGSINSLVEKITPLMENHPKTKKLLQDLKSLRVEMNKFAGGRAAGEQVNVWMKQVREMVYDIEDWIYLKKDFSESDMEEIEDFRDEIQEARSRCLRYELLKQAPTSDAEIVYSTGPRGRRLFLEEKTVFVGRDHPKSELLGHLKDEQKDLKVVSIHGRGGHGKTALAKEIYGDIYIKGQFEYKAFVSVGRNSSMKTTLIEILRQVKSSEVDACQTWSSNDEQINEIITELWGFLHTKRYFICIDDIRTANDLEVILCALPDNDLGSRILTTTRMKDIAILFSRRPNDVVYEMMALNETDSKSLFRNCLYVQEEEWTDHFKELSKEILEVCGGLPLAIIVTAGFLWRTSAELPLQSEKLKKAIPSEFDEFYSESEAMRKILDASYADLPQPLKSCFLYLTAFSGNYGIKKDRLVRRWVAEGLIPERHGNSSWETGEGYFDELIGRRLIQPAFDGNDDQPIGCTVHGVVFDFLESMSSKENFITPGAELKSELFPCERVRRVSLDCGDEDEGDTLITYCLLEKKSLVASSCDEEKDDAIILKLSRVRSLAFSGDAGRIPNLSALKHLRVLDLEDTKGLANERLESIGHLSLLRYLGLGGTDVTKLPQQIMALEQLTTLDLRRTSLKRLPVLSRNTKLMSLLADQLAITPTQMSRMQNLEELSKVLMGPDGSLASELARHVNKLGSLRMLGIRISHRHSAMDQQGVKHLLEDLGKSNLQSLLLDNCPLPLLDLLVDYPLAQNLQKFELRMHGCLPQVPQEIASLIAITHLHIKVEAVEEQAVRALGSLPNLVVLRLDLNSSPSMTVSPKDGFQCLKVLWFNSQYGGVGKGIQFEAGAMPQLRRLWLELNVQVERSKHDAFDLGIQHLPSLVHVHATIDWMNTTLTSSEVDAAEAKIREQVSQNPNNPVLELNRRQPRYITKASEELVITVNSLQEWGKQINPRKLVVVHFSAAWCRASRKMSPVFADLAEKYRNVVFLKVDVGVEEMKTVATEFSIEGVPTFLFMKGGNIKRRVKGADKEKLGGMVEELADLML